MLRYRQTPDRGSTGLQCVRRPMLAMSRGAMVDARAILPATDGDWRAGAALTPTPAETTPPGVPAVAV